MKLNRKEAIEALKAGKVVGFAKIPGVEMYKVKNKYLFKHRDGSVELLNHMTIEDQDGYVLLRHTRLNETILQKWGIVLQ